MKLSAHIEELSDKHRSLQGQIEDEMSRPLVDSLRISFLKRQKLRLKDRIERLRGYRKIA